MSNQKQLSMPMALKIDHVTIAGSKLASLEQAFANLGLATEYGGPHSNNVTHMAFLGFVDGSYIELISAIEGISAKAHAFWDKHIADDGGPCAWAVQVDDVAAETARVAELGIHVEGPAYYSRRRPDHSVVEWDLAFLGGQGAGARLPFIIKDITPRELRVRPADSVADGLLTGVAKVVLGVADLEASIRLFQLVYGWPEPYIDDHPDFGAELADFEGSPVTLATPLPGHAWLSDRLARYGESPCAFLLGARDFTEARQRYQLVQSSGWFKHQVAWFDPAQLKETKLGVIG
ncbi:MAG: VOC family protein [Anaerolineae bacterium]|nr:VOC family protein [Anaerolineae bacterium]